MSLFSGGNGQTEDSQGGIQDHGAYHLYDEDQRDPDAKQRLACLVTEKIHAGEPTGGSPDETQTDKGSFFDAPFMIGGFPFIDTEAGEGDNGGDDDISKYDAVCRN